MAQLFSTRRPCLHFSASGTKVWVGSERRLVVSVLLVAVTALLAGNGVTSTAAPPGTPAATVAATKVNTSGSAGPVSKAARAALNLANHHYKLGHFKKASALYHEAFEIDARAAFLFNAARAQMRGFDHTTAKRDFNRYLALADATDKGRNRAKMHLQEIEAYDARMTEHRQKADAKAAQAAKIATERAHRPMGLLTGGLWIGTGVLLVGSGSLYGVAALLRSRTNAMVVKREADRISHNADVARQNGLRNASVLLFLGAAGTGTWAYFRMQRSAAPAQTSAISATLGSTRITRGLDSLRWAPWNDGRGFSLMGRF